MIFINFKNYSQGLGKAAVKLAKICQRQSRKYSVPIAVCPSIADLFRVASTVRIPVWCQHLDLQPLGKSTGWLVAEAVSRAGAEGSLLNHSEHPIAVDKLQQSVSRAKSAGLKTMVLVPDLNMARKAQSWQPDYCGWEDPDLIGTGDSMLSDPDKTDQIKKLIDLSSVRPVIGAGISTPDDIRMSLKLGVRTILVSSAVVTSSDPEQVLGELLQAYSDSI